MLTDVRSTFNLYLSFDLQFFVFFLHFNFQKFKIRFERIGRVWSLCAEKLFYELKCLSLLSPSVYLLKSNQAEVILGGGDVTTLTPSLSVALSRAEHVTLM